MSEWKAIILAAGQGSRLRPLTDSTPKCLVPYKGRPLLEYILASMEKGGINQISLVSGYCADKLEKYKIPLYHNEEYTSTNMVHSLFCAEQELDGTSDIVISYSDIIYSPQVLQALIESEADLAITVDVDWQKLWGARMDDPLNDAETLKIDNAGNVIELGKRPSSIDEIQAQYMGLIKIGKSVQSSIRKFYYELDRSEKYDGQSFRNMYMTSFLQLVINHLAPVQAVQIRGGWLEVDEPGDLKIDFDTSWVK